MKITKFGHCCMLVEEKGSGDTLRVLTDPGSYTETQNEITNIDVVLITHEHGDHLHIDSVKKILEKNKPLIITNSSVDAILKKEGINGARIVEDGESFEYKGLQFKAFGKLHEVIHKEWSIVQNTGYSIGERLFYPGDAFTNPKIPVDILALPVSGPWVKISDAIDCCIAINPKIAFPVHDGGLNENGLGFNRRVAPQILEKHGIKFQVLEIGKETEL